MNITFKTKTFIFLSLLCFVSLSVHSQQLKTGDQAPEIEQKLLSGEAFRLSDLRGKVVLIDFWAAWCKPCRKANPEIVELYEEYENEAFENGNGFAIVSISLDFNKKMWKKAIEKDNLHWPYHIGGESGWTHPAVKKYQVNSIPTSFLIDGEGTIIGMNLRGDELEKTLKKQLKQRFFLFF